VNDDETKKKKAPKPALPVPHNRASRRAMKRDRLKLIQGGKPPDAPKVDMSQPAGRFAFHLHEFIVRYVVANPDLERTAACAAALQVAGKFAVELGGNAEEFSMAAAHFFNGEAEARAALHPPDGPGAG
jgi:hypothetical protein